MPPHVWFYIETNEVDQICCEPAAYIVFHLLESLVKS